MSPDQPPQPATHPCYAMNDRELVATLTLDKAQYREPFIAVATGELARRGLDLGQYLEQVQAGRNNTELVSCTSAQALALLREEVSLWDLRVLVNCLGQVLVLQKERQCWSVHYYEDEEYGGSFFVAQGEAVQELCAAFLHLQPWRHQTGPWNDLKRWKTAAQSRNQFYIEQVAAGLDDLGVPYTVQTPVFSGTESGVLTVLIPTATARQARRVVAALEAERQTLYEHAQQQYDQNDLEGEQKTYQRLVQVAPENPAVFYNWGSVLIELGRNEEAAEAFIEAVSLGLPDLSKSLASASRQATGGIGGRLGLLLLLFKRWRRPQSSAQSPTGDYPDFIDDAELILEDLAGRLPRPIRLLHCLATIARLKDTQEQVGRLYRRILSLDPEDEIARFNLGYLQASRETD
ncbi:MAG: hypothetical protein GKR89_19350 [Candidatus Latescibacteria bacterium]|nr:hypothetical protein [Candidatus Latescibacterota bacterium]